MVECSKLMFEQHFSNAKCCQLTHPWTKSCLDINTIMNFSQGGFKFFGLFYAMRFIVSGMKPNKKYLLKLLMEYIVSGVFASCVGIGLLEFSCIFRNLFGKFYYYNLIFIPTFISGFTFIFLEPPHRRYFLNNVFVNLVFEYWIRTLEYKGYVKSTHLKATIMFMFGSSYLLYLMRQEQEKIKKMSFIWFFTPPKVNRKSATSNDTIYPSHCPHEDVCQKYIFKGTVQMFSIGCAMSILRTIIPLLGNPMKAIRSITKKHFTLGLFFGGYIGIYRLVTCLLCQHYKKDSTQYALPAGFLAGSAMWFSPNLSISLASITSILHILVSRMYDNKMLPEKIPLPEILFGICLAIVIHAGTVHSNICPNYGLRIKRLVTNNLSLMVEDVISSVPIH